VLCLVAPIIGENVANLIMSYSSQIKIFLNESYSSQCDPQFHCCEFLHLMSLDAKKISEAILK
jgi:hypothetical protein